MAYDNAMYGDKRYQAPVRPEVPLSASGYGEQRSRGQVLGPKTTPPISDGGGKKTSSSATAAATTGAVSGGGFDLAGYLEAVRAQQRADAEAAYARARNNLNEAYNSASSAYGNIYDSGVSQLGRSYDNSRGKINSEATDAFRQAYVNRMLSEKNLGQRMAAMGMSGGASESTLAGLINNYGNARSGIQRTLDTNLGDLEMKYQGNLADLYNAYQQNMANIAAQRASQLSNLEMQLANLNANMGGDYYSAMLSNIGNLQRAANSATANQAAYTAPNAQTVTNTFTPANIQQANDMGGTMTNWTDWQKKMYEDMVKGSTQEGAIANLYDSGLTEKQVIDFLNSLR